MLLRPLHAQPPGTAVRQLQENQQLIARWEIIRVLLGTEGNVWPRRGWVRLLQDGTPRWLLGGGRSLTHPSMGIILLYQLEITAHTKALAPAPLLPIRALLSAGRGAATPLARSHGDWSGTKLLKAPLGATAAPSIGNGPRRLLRHPSAQPQPGHLTATRPLQATQTRAARSPDTIACTSSHLYLPPRLYIGEEAHL